jgi:hypothetical protein
MKNERVLIDIDVIEGNAPKYSLIKEYVAVGVGKICIKCVYS